ncbi:MAG: membrane dipeptidase [Anaerolineae bacterium]|nr:membrane dipeptidase [Anaerolineae bacterium]
MPLIVDSHQDLAWNMLSFGRDYTRSVYETRKAEIGSATIEHNGDTLLGWPEFQQAEVALIFATLFSPPARWAFSWEKYLYRNPKEAKIQYRQQLDLYNRLSDENPEKFRLITSALTLEEILDNQNNAKSAQAEYPIALILLMEGADCILDFADLEEWWGLGVRLIGPAWAGTRFCGGTKEPGPLTPDGRKLLSIMAEHGFILDLSHMDEPAVLESLDMYPGHLAATHANCKDLMPNYEINRLLSDRVISGILERDGIVGVVPYNTFLLDGWLIGKSDREEVSIENLVDHIDHICQIAGDAQHVGIGSDFDGGFGLQSTPKEIDTIVDLQKLVPSLLSRGYSDEESAAILGGNWISYLNRNLPAS